MTTHTSTPRAVRTERRTAGSDNGGHTHVEDGIAVLEFDGDGHNTFPTEKMENIAAQVSAVAEDPEVKALVLHAGDGRSFGVGGDFNEVSTFTGGSEVSRWIDACVDMYRSVLACPKPTVAVIDGFCIGIGLQLALCADWRVATPTADLRMPELKLGISCILGVPLLRSRVSPHVANRMIIGCDSWVGDEALADGLVDELINPGASTPLHVGIERATSFAAYQTVPFTRTKAFSNHDLLLAMEEARIQAISGHRAGFASGDAAQQKMRTVIGADR